MFFFLNPLNLSKKVNLVVQFMTDFWEQMITELSSAKKNISTLQPKVKTYNKVRYYLGVDKSKYLTPRELQCFELIKKGFTMKEAGSRLKLSHRTVEFYLQNIKQRLGLKTMKEVIEFVKNNNITKK